MKNKNYYIPKIDRQLHCSNRSMKTHQGKLLFGPAGNRLFVDYLERRPGFCGRIDFIHKCNITSLFEVRCSTNPDFEVAECMWYPSKFTMEYEDRNVSLTEVKMITKDDMAISIQTWKNKSEKPIELELHVEAAGCMTEQDSANTYFLQTPQLSHGYRVGAAISWNASKTNKTFIKPQEELTVIAVACAGNMETETKEELLEKVASFKKNLVNEEEIINTHGKEYQSFFDQIPHFNSSDQVLNKTWYYRWYILKNCISKPQFGYLKDTVMYEGRGHKTGKEPLKPNGWEFCRLICLSTPLHLTDLKWSHNKELIHELIRSFLNCQGEDGIVNSAFVDHFGSPFSNYIVWAVYNLYLLDGDREFIREIAPKLKAFIDGNRKAYDSENDKLQVEVRHQRTGKEFQPSYWYFSDYPQNTKAPGAMTPLKRVDRTIYHYLNVLGYARMLKDLNDDSFMEYQELADTIAAQVNEKMWDKESGFYYDLHHLTDEKAMVKNIVGIYPYWAGISEEEHEKGLEYLFSKDYFATGSAFATVAKDCPAFSPAGGWMGVIRGRNSCMWAGPSWPYTNGITLDAIGKESKKLGHRYDTEFTQFLREYAWQHFESHDLNRPYLVEQYHAITGEPISDEPDYNHSYFLNLIISHVCGVEVEENKIVIDPIDVQLSYFTLDDLYIKGHKYNLSYEKVEGNEWDKDSKQGFCIYQDDQLIHASEKLEKVMITIMK